MSYKDEILKEVLRSAMPKARLLERRPAVDSISASDAAEAAAPGLESLVRKYAVDAPKKRKAVSGSDAAPANADDAVETARVLIETSDEFTSDVAKRLAKRTVVIDTKSKKLLGSSG